jgi:adenylate cyclase
MSDDSTLEATFCFVDIAGYTALTDTHGGQAAADLVDEFASLVRATAEPHGRLQSLIGDCAFLVFPDPVTATTALAALYAEIADRRHFPIVRTGLHHGSVLCRGGQHFGSTVNIAARVAAQAVGGELLCTESVAQALAQARHPDVTLVHRGATALKNLSEPLDLYEILLAGSAREFVIDPVCKMQVDKRQAAGDLHVDGRTYWFCSLDCVERFARQPGAYAARATAGTKR